MITSAVVQVLSDYIVHVLMAVVLSFTLRSVNTIVNSFLFLLLDEFVRQSSFEMKLLFILQYMFIES